MTDGVTLIVLAGGEGKRFWPMATDKALLPLFGLPFFAQTIGDVPPDITKLIIVTNPVNNDVIRSYRFPIEASTVMQETPTGMADAILACKQIIGHGPILIINIDDVIDPALMSGVLEVAKKTGAFGVAPGWKAPQFGSYGYLAIENGRVTGIVEKPEKGKEPSPYINIVCHYLTDGGAFIEELERTTVKGDDVYERALSTLMTQKEFRFVTYTGAFVGLKYPWHILDALHILLPTLTKHKGKGVVIKQGVILEGPVYLEDGVKIYEHTKIVGPCYIGKNTVIGNNCIIRESHIGADCVVGFNCDITRSYIGDNCWFHMNYVGDSVIERNVSMGGGATLANLRLDDGEISSEVMGKRVATGRTKFGSIVAPGTRIGVNASIMPGVKIGMNSFVGSGVILDKDLQEGSFCVAKPGYIITKNKQTAASSRESFKRKL